MDSFFGIGLPELILILIVAGIVMGPERIGQTARWLGRTTSQLQKISRTFVRQLNQELDSSVDGQVIKETMQELKQLRKELTDLRTEVTQTTSSATRAGQKAFDEINNSIKPPSLKPPTLSPSPINEATTNGQSKAAEDETEGRASTVVPPLPKLLDIPDDPE